MCARVAARALVVARDCGINAAVGRAPHDVVRLFLRQLAPIRSSTLVSADSGAMAVPIVAFADPSSRERALAAVIGNESSLRVNQVARLVRLRSLLSRFSFSSFFVSLSLPRYRNYYLLVTLSITYIGESRRRVRTRAHSHVS